MAKKLMFNMCKFITQGRKIVGVGLNYKSVAQEKSLQIPPEPIIFLKPPSSYIQEDQEIVIPDNYDVHHEVELAIIIGKKGKCIPIKDAMSYIGGYGLALDLTAINEKEKAAKAGNPWTLSKSFDTSTPMSEAISKECLSCPDRVTLWLKLNDEMKQEGNTNDMIFNIAQLISYISTTMTLEPYDVILTGTPKGSGPIKSGDTICAGIGNLIAVKYKVC